MKTLNSFQTPQQLESGLYRIKLVARMQDASLFPMATVLFKKDVSYIANPDAMFIVSLESLYHAKSVGPKHLLPEELSRKTVHIKSVYKVPEGKPGQMRLMEAAEWSILDKFAMYDLYKQQGEGLLVVPPHVYAEYDELEQLQEIHEAESLEIRDMHAHQNLIDSGHAEIDAEREQQEANKVMSEEIIHAKKEG